MMTRVWSVTKGFQKGTKVEEYKYNDGTLHYSFKTHDMRTHNIKDFDEAMKIVKRWGMEDITERMIEAGWIRKEDF